MAQIDRTPARTATKHRYRNEVATRGSLKICSGQSVQAFSLPVRRYADLCDRIIANSVLAQDSFFEGTPCWLWIGRTYVNRTGAHYGKINVYHKRKGKMVTLKVHRVAVVEFHGRKLTRRQPVMHKCNNTLCCNPAHLAGGTASKNMKQMVRDGRGKNQFGAERMAA